jgi:hypothetical protein
MQIKKHIRKPIMPIEGNSTWNGNKINFMAFVTRYMMTKRKQYDKEQNSIWISQCFIRWINMLIELTVLISITIYELASSWQAWLPCLFLVSYWVFQISQTCHSIIVVSLLII